MNFGGVWDQLVACICRPPRDTYTFADLVGGTKGRFAIDGGLFKREDLTLVNKRGQKLECSHYQPIHPPKKSAGCLPCVIYCHCNSGSRRDAEEALPVLLPHHITVFCLDFAGSGMSGGDYVTLGALEVDDLEAAVDHLRARHPGVIIGLWGRSMGSVTALAYAKRDPSIAGMVLDSPFARLRDLMVELAAEQKLPIPRPLMRVALTMMRRSVRRRAGFSIDDVAPVDWAPSCHIPVLLGHATEDTFIGRHHAEALKAAYAGDANLVKFSGDHNSFRPPFFYSSVVIFFHNVLQCAQPLPGPAPAPPPLLHGLRWSEVTSRGAAGGLAPARSGVASPLGSTRGLDQAWASELSNRADSDAQPQKDSPSDVAAEPPGTPCDAQSTATGHRSSRPRDAFGVDARVAGLLGWDARSPKQAASLASADPGGQEWAAAEASHAAGRQPESAGIPKASAAAAAAVQVQGAMAAGLEQLATLEDLDAGYERWAAAIEAEVEDEDALLQRAIALSLAESKGCVPHTAPAPVACSQPLPPQRVLNGTTSFIPQHLLSLSDEDAEEACIAAALRASLAEQEPARPAVQPPAPASCGSLQDKDLLAPGIRQAPNPALSLPAAGPSGNDWTALWVRRVSGARPIATSTHASAEPSSSRAGLPPADVPISTRAAPGSLENKPAAAASSAATAACCTPAGGTDLPPMPSAKPAPSQAAAPSPAVGLGAAAPTRVAEPCKPDSAAEQDALGGVSSPRRPAHPSETMTRPLVELPSSAAHGAALQSPPPSPSAPATPSVRLQAPASSWGGAADSVHGFALVSSQEVPESLLSSFGSLGGSRTQSESTELAGPMVMGAASEDQHQGLAVTGAGPHVSPLASGEGRRQLLDFFTRTPDASGGAECGIADEDMDRAAELPPLRPPAAHGQSAA